MGGDVGPGDGPQWTKDAGLRVRPRALYDLPSPDKRLLVSDGDVAQDRQGRSAWTEKVRLGETRLQGVPQSLVSTTANSMVRGVSGVPPGVQVPRRNGLGE